MWHNRSVNFDLLCGICGVTQLIVSLLCDLPFYTGAASDTSASAESDVHASTKGMSDCI